MSTLDTRIRCSDCGTLTPTPLVWMRQHNEILCACGTAIDLDRRSFPEGICDIGRIVAELLRRQRWIEYASRSLPLS